MKLRETTIRLIFNVLVAGSLVGSSALKLLSIPAKELAMNEIFSIHVISQPFGIVQKCWQGT